MRLRRSSLRRDFGHSSSRGFARLGILALPLVFMAAAVGGGAFLATGTEKVGPFCVDEKERARNREGADTKYVEVTYKAGGTETFTVDDSLAQWNFHSGDTFRDLKEGACFGGAEVNWFRSAPLSQYRNVLKTW